VNCSSAVAFVAFSCSNAMKRPSIAGLLCSMHSLSSVTSFLNLDISTLVVDAASLSVLMNFLFSPIPLCISAQYLPYAVNVCVFRSMALANSICWWCNLMQFPYIYCSNSFMVVFPLFSWSFRNWASLLNYLSYCPTCWCRWASSASKAAVDGCWKLKSRSSIFTAVGSVVSRCSKELSVWEMGIIAGSVGWYVCRLVCWLISGF
jgi:hypothetical protein